MEAFIECVRAEPCLWNPLHPDYRETVIKDDTWHRVIDKYNNKSIPNIQVAKSEWKRLRDNHRDALKRAKLGKNKLLPAHITTWKYAKAMQFLEPHMKYRITEHIEMEPTATNYAKSPEQDVSTTDNENQPTKRRCVERTNDDTTAKSRHEDALESFFNCVLQSTREMPQWMQTQVKKKIFAVIIEAEEKLSSQVQSSQHESLVVEPHLIKTEVFNEESSDNSYYNS